MPGTIWIDDEEALVFDFEAALPALLAAASTALPQDEDAKKDFKRGTVVCRHWLRGLCMKGDNCEFLHQYDMSKMPECRWGMECQVPECPFRHVPDEDRMECAFYKQGFCSHGSACRYRHVKLPRDECPVIADFGLQSKAAEEESAKRRKTQPVNEFFKIAICKHWEKQGTCPFGDECHFAHGEKELRPFPKDAGKGDNHHGGGDRGPSDRGGDRGHHSSGPSHKAPEVHAPMLPDDTGRSAYFYLRSASYQNVAQSMHHNQWAVSLPVLKAITDASMAFDNVFVFLTVSPSLHIQCVARVMQLPPAPADEASATPLDATTLPHSEWRHAIGVQWLRTAEIPYETADTIPTTTETPLSKTPNGATLVKECGHGLMHKLFFHPMIRLHLKSVEDEMKLPGGALELATRRRMAAESVAGFVDPSIPLAPPAHRWQVNLPGFVFACNGTTIDEVFGRMLFGLAKDHEQVAAKNVRPGAPLFLINMSDRHVLGMFEAVTPIVPNMVPNAFAHSPNVPSPFPIQVRFQVVLNAPPVLNDHLKSVPGLERGIRIGPLTLAATQALANVFAERCGATNLGPNGELLTPVDPSTATSATSAPTTAPPTMTTSAPTTTTTTTTTATGELLEKIPVGIEADHEFGPVRRIIGPAGSYMKRIIADAGGNAKVRLRGRGSGYECRLMATC
ncbi:hypothetical protein SDRG_00589 [Saprolegnia diclina VS20]|uniref:Cleavage and polyadenylation specificity factor subunit 4 n=1 Tax=Saprolegnia diclina (strain VS20) TaxID=1156394 RepID=T0R8R3_SAPDV|nr:hypothetical protein SDRG_00589 [Saprolegnia diclina VS20]EQC42870.1 hypothetical protein SDRG_00589 [Saprolegnia diclina VS20]|eukprot:XP_008604293.1 hypothetical protein SDRG_00589 [Saprolegnia diclina VS20]